MTNYIVNTLNDENDGINVGGVSLRDAINAANANANDNNISIATATVTIADNDTPGVTISQTGGSTKITEGGATDTYSIVLNSQPTANVTIAIANDSQTSTNVNSVTFTPANWNVAQTVTVTAVDDDVVEGNHTGTITHTATSADANYNNISITSITANITDNDFNIINVNAKGNGKPLTGTAGNDRITGSPGVKTITRPIAIVQIDRDGALGSAVFRNLITLKNITSSQNDKAFVTINRDSNITGNLLSGSSPFSYVLSTGGNYDIGIGVVDVKDSIGQSTLQISNGNLQPVPEPTTILGSMIALGVGMKMMRCRKNIRNYAKFGAPTPKI